MYFHFENRYTRRWEKCFRIEYLQPLDTMSLVEVFSRYVNTGFEYKVSPFEFTFKKTTWKLEFKKQKNNHYKFVNLVGCFLLFLTSNNFLLQIVRYLRRPFHLGLALAYYFVFIFCSYSQFLCLSNSGAVECVNNFFTLIPVASKSMC